MQATNDTANGAEFLLVSLELVTNRACANIQPKAFDDGGFSEDATFLVSHRGINHLLPCQLVHLYSLLASFVVLQIVLSY